MRLVLIDDHTLFREGVAALLGSEQDLTIVGQGGTADDAVRLAGGLTPDILLLDLNIPGGGGLLALPRILRASPATRVVILTASESETSVLEAMRLGAKGYVLKGVSARQLTKIMREVYTGAGYVPPELAVQVLASVANTPATIRPASLLEQLSEQEHQILELVTSGSSNRQIAAALQVTETCIKNHMTTIMRKLRVRNRVEAAMLAGRVSWELSSTSSKAERSTMAAERD